MTKKNTLLLFITCFIITIAGTSLFKTQFKSSTPTDSEMKPKSYEKGSDIKDDSSKQRTEEKEPILVTAFHNDLIRIQNNSELTLTLKDIFEVGKKETDDQHYFPWNYEGNYSDLTDAKIKELDKMTTFGLLNFTDPIEPGMDVVFNVSGLKSTLDDGTILLVKLFELDDPTSTYSYKIDKLS